MKHTYEVYSCNGGNPTAIIMNSLSDEDNLIVVQKIFESNSKVDQAAIILDVSESNCIFRLSGGEFCGNACLSVGAFMHKKYNIENGSITNIVNGNNGSIVMRSKCDGELCSLRILKEELILSKGITENDRFYVKLNGITHIIVNDSFEDKNKLIAEKEIKEFGIHNEMPDVLGIIFLHNNNIDPFIWISKIAILQHQTSCLSGSIAAFEHIQPNQTEEVVITQPTGESYRITTDNKYINIISNIQHIKSGMVSFDCV